MKLTNRPGRPTTLLKIVALLLLLFAAGGVVRFAHATPTSIVDTTPGTATADGTINPSEYSGYSVGINHSVGIIGSDAALYIDSGGTLEEVVFGLKLKPDRKLLDFVVIYFDTVAGGLADTTELADLADFYSMAVSGTNEASSANLHFGPDFRPDYALAFNAYEARLYQLVENTPDTLSFAGLVDLVPEDDEDAGQYELSFSMADIGVAQGSSFKYVATLVRSQRGLFWRYDEFNGVSEATYDAEEADLQTDFNLASGDYHTFTTMSPTAVGQLASRATPFASNRGWIVLLFFATLMIASSRFLARRQIV